MALALIDGDMIAFYSCDRKLPGEAPREPTPEEHADHLERAWQQFLRYVVGIKTALFAEAAFIAVKGEGNYRKDMYPDYKLQRKAGPSGTNKIVPALRQRAVDCGMAVAAHGREADDLLQMWAEQARYAGDHFYVCSDDKDLQCIPGMHWSPKKKLLTTVSELTALRNFYAQLLKGDLTDNIPGIPGVGPKTAENWLVECTDELSMQDVVVDRYMQSYGDDWQAYLLANGKMLYLQKHETDFFTLDTWPAVKELREWL